MQVVCQAPCVRGFIAAVVCLRLAVVHLVVELLLTWHTQCNPITAVRATHTPDLRVPGVAPVIWQRVRQSPLGRGTAPDHQFVISVVSVCETAAGAVADIRFDGVHSIVHGALAVEVALGVVILTLPTLHHLWRLCLLSGCGIYADDVDGHGDGHAQ